MTFDDVEAYLAMLSNALRKRGVSNPRMLEEARGHLADAVADGIRRGLDPRAAQRQALARFGSADSVAATFAAETYGVRDRLVLLAGAMMGIAIAYVDSRPNWDDTGTTAFALVMAGATCGFVAPRRPWRWALAAGIWISIFAMFRSASPSALAMLIVVAFPLAGAYAGAAMRGALWKSPRRVDGHQVFHDKSGEFDFVVVSKRGWVNPELAAVVADPDTQLVPFLARMAPAALAPLGHAHSLTRLDDQSAGSHVRKFEVVFGDEKKVLCRIEIARSGRRLSVHWSCPGN
jgi:hypothetical protein